MNVLMRILGWFGFGKSGELRKAVALRNMPIMVGGTILSIVFVSMLLFCMVGNIACPVDGFDDAIDDPVTKNRFLVFCSIALALMVLFFAFSFVYMRKRLDHSRLASAVVMVFSLVFVMIWGVADSGRPIDNQVLIFASMQFLIAGLMVFSPLDSFVYFVGSFFLFGFMLRLYDGSNAHGAGELAYLATLDITVSWIVYSLFHRGVQRERAIVDESRRDELTGAKNRHYLRDDVERLSKSQYFVMLCDIDDFKHYNDDYNHEAGDTLLKEFFFALRESYGDECTYRYGGDEFLILSPDFDEREFQKKAQRVSKQLESIQVENENAHLTYSGGYKFGELAKIEDFRSMLHGADEHLLAIKHSGKKRVEGSRYVA